MADLRMIYVAAGDDISGPELRCHDHEKWWAGADAEDLPTVIRRAVEHFRDEHRVHVADCMCRDRVVDGRCVPHINLGGE